MRPFAGVVLALLVVLAGCNAPLPGSDGPGATTNSTGTAAPAAESTPENGGDGSGDGDGDAGPGARALPDPPEDRIGWEDGYWHNESIDVDNSDGLDEAEREAVVARAMARIEVIREREFEGSVPVEVITREEYRNRTVPEYGDAFRTFDNAKFEALLLVGEDADALAVQNENSGTTVLAYYDPRNDTIVLVSDTDRSRIDGESTLAHELTHALQDQRFNLSSIRAETRDEYNGQSGLIEGEANVVQREYVARCGEEWECVDSIGTESSGDVHFGIYFIKFFPYSDGPTFVRSLHESGGWDAVDRAFERPPTSARQVLYPGTYPDEDPAAVELRDTTTGEWERVHPEPTRSGQSRPDYAELGPSALASMFTYTAYDRSNRSSLVSQEEFLNVDEDGTLDSSDPIDYDLPVVRGWAGDRLHVYRSPVTAPGETAYVWRIVWNDAENASAFAGGYRALLSYWGGERTGGAGTWRIGEDSPFADAFYVEVDGRTVTIVNAPTSADLGAVYAGYDG